MDRIKMILKEQNIETKYLFGEQYLCSMEDFENVEINERDNKGRNILILNQKNVRFNVYVSRAFDSTGTQIGYYINNVDYKSTIFDGLDI